VKPCALCCESELIRWLAGHHHQRIKRCHDWLTKEH